MKPDYSEEGGIYKAAEQGNADAQYDLGAMYNFGEGMEQDNAEAIKWFLKAAEQDHADADLRFRKRSRTSVRNLPVTGGLDH